MTYVLPRGKILYVLKTCAKFCFMQVTEMGAGC